MTPNSVLWQNNARAITPKSTFWNGVPDFDVKGIGISFMFQSRLRTVRFLTVSEATWFLARNLKLKTNVLLIHKRLFDPRKEKEPVLSEVQPLVHGPLGLTFLHVGTGFFTSDGNTDPENRSTDSQYILAKLVETCKNEPKTVNGLVAALEKTLRFARKQIIKPSIFDIVIASSSFVVICSMGMGKAPIPMYFRRGGIQEIELSSEPTADVNSSDWDMFPANHVMIVTKNRFETRPLLQDQCDSCSLWRILFPKKT